MTNEQRAKAQREHLAHDLWMARQIRRLDLAVYALALVVGVFMGCAFLAAFTN